MTGKLYSSCVEWLDDWTRDMPPMVDTYDLAQWMEDEGAEAIQFFLESAFRKPRTRADALDILRALVWEHFLFQRDSAIRRLSPAKEAVGRLLALPQTAQKSAAWYAEARNLLTGHEFAGVVYGTETAFQSAVARKCCPEIVLTGEEPPESRTVYRTPADTEEGRTNLSPFQWGWRYEPVVRTIYEEWVAKGRVDDTLGRIRHPTLPRLAASPDGLVCEGPRAGRLVEIKSPITRVLTGVLPEDYYCQIQLQAEVANVEAVDYVEVRFEAQPAEDLKTEDLQKFLTPPPTKPMHSEAPPPAAMGVVLVVAPDVDADPLTWTYAYSPCWPLELASVEMVRTWMPADLSERSVILERSVWRVQDWWMTTVVRNRRWWSEVGEPAYRRFWEAVDDARTTSRFTTTCLIEDDEENDSNRKCFIMDIE